MGDENFWGGPTFVRGQGYVQLPNNGEQRHHGLETRAHHGVASITETLAWITQAGEQVFSERRALTARVVDAATWELTFDSAMTSTASRPLSIGSPTTRGRDNAGYGGLFWRGPRSFTGGVVLAPGVEGGDELRGESGPWMGFRGVHDGDGSVSTIVMVDDPGNGGHPPQWFARTEEFACLCPAPFFSEEREIAPGETMRERYAVLIHDGGWDAAAAGRAADDAGDLLRQGR